MRQTEVCVVWGPREAKAPLGVLQLTVLIGSNRSEADKAAVLALLDAVKRIQDLPSPQTGQAS